MTDKGNVILPREPTVEMIAAAAIAVYPIASPTDMETARRAADLVLMRMNAQPGTTRESVAMAIAMMLPACRAMIAAAPDAQVAVSFQAGVAEWMAECFIPSLYSNMIERGDRLLEEVLELLQAHGYGRERVATLVNYVYGRPAGEPAQEVGGVMVTLAGYCWIAGLDMHAAGDAELTRISTPEVMAKIRTKQEQKNALHFDTPLPGAVPPPPPPGPPFRSVKGIVQAAAAPAAVDAAAVLAELLAAIKERDEATAAWDRLTGSARQYPGPEYQRARKADDRYAAALGSALKVSP